ncbi:hypothetical protein TgHK011_009340 [Trichoderma gracile]|nr:hypothetical protein TgHK011_009340 [Trichoderma gracile]
MSINCRLSTCWCAHSAPPPYQTRRPAFSAPHRPSASNEPAQLPSRIQHSMPRKRSSTLDGQDTHRQQIPPSPLLDVKAVRIQRRACTQTDRHTSEPETAGPPPCSTAQGHRESGQNSLPSRAAFYCNSVTNIS